jgi:hypothetical protein
MSRFVIKLLLIRMQNRKKTLKGLYIDVVCIENKSNLMFLPLFGSKRI